ncbi:MAG: VWA domain-containing protein [Planctomycetota bacterium]
MPVAVVLIVYLARTSHTGLARWRWWSSLVARLVLALALVAALAGATLHKKKDELAVYFVLDVSKSVDPETRKMAEAFIEDAMKQLVAGKDRAGLIFAATHPAIEHGLDTSFDPSSHASIINTDYTDLSEAIRLAVAAFPEGVQKRIVVLSDGKENIGDALEAARAASAAGIEVWSVPLPGKTARDVAIRKITVPGDVKLKEAFEVTVHTRVSGAASDRAVPVRLHVWRNREYLGSLETEVRPGDDAIPIPQKIRPKKEEKGEGAGFYEYEVVVESREDGVGDNNRAFGFAHVEGEPRIAYVEGKSGESRALKQALLDAGVSNLQVLTPALLPDTPAALQRYDAVILSDVSAQYFSGGEGGTMKMFHDYVEGQGGGLVMIGGDRSFGVGGYYRTYIERVLPVSMDIRKKKYRASMATVIAIDQSGSMSMTVPGGQTKIQLANEAACRAVDLMREDDWVGILYVDTSPKWAVDMGPVVDKQDIFDKIRSNQGGGGGIYVKTALWEAWRVLEKVDAVIKHIILFSDASDSEQQEGCVSRAKKERKRGRTLTVIGMGSKMDCHAKFLENLAKAGDGRYYITNDVRNLPRIFTEDILIASKSAIVEKTFQAIPVASAAMIDGIDWAKAPPLHGYVTTTLKPRGEMILQGLEEEDPLLAKWQYGLGRAVAFTSDAKAKWARDWMGWESFGKFWAQILRWVSRRTAAVPFRTRVYFEQGRGRIVVDAYDEKGDPQNFLDLRAHVTHRDAQPQKIRLQQKASGRYEAEFDADKFDPAPARLHLLRDLSRSGNGRLLDAPAGIFRLSGRIARAPLEIWPTLLALALALLLLDVLCRRLAIPDLALAAVERAAAFVRLRRLEKKAAPSPELSRLMEAKSRAIEEQEPAPSAPAPELEKIFKKTRRPSKAADAPAAETEEKKEEKKRVPKPASAESYTARLLEAKKRARKKT